MFLTKRSQWIGLVDYVRSQPEQLMGLDSEFEGVNFDAGDSCVNRADIVVFSVGVLTGQLHPRGYFRSVGSVLPVDALAEPLVKELLEDPNVIKPAHNSNVDVHAFYNKGVDCKGVVNTLSFARWVFPGRLTYNLDDLGVDLLGEGKTESFFDLLRIPKYENIPKQKIAKKKACACGEVGCRKRKPRDGVIHDKTPYEEIEEYVIEKRVGWNFISQKEIIADVNHPLRARYLAYAQRDATLAVSLYDYLRRQTIQTEIPWYAKQHTGGESK